MIFSNHTVSAIKTFFFVSLFYLLSAGNCFADSCYAKQAGVAVIQPYLTEKVCFLYEHSKLKPVESEMKQTIAGEEGLDPDPLMAEFLYLIINKRYRAIPKGTPFFNCQYDLGTLKRDPQFAKLNGIEFPEFHCRGILSPFVPVRIIDENSCWWVALELVDCGNIPDDYDVEMRWRRDPNVKW